MSPVRLNTPSGWYRFLLMTKELHVLPEELRRQAAKPERSMMTDAGIWLKRRAARGLAATFAQTTKSH